jgi:hypothetical protein
MRDYGSLEARDLPRRSPKMGKMLAVSLLSAFALVAVAIYHNQVSSVWLLDSGAWPTSVYDFFSRSDAILSNHTV